MIMGEEFCDRTNGHTTTVAANKGDATRARHHEIDKRGRAGHSIDKMGWDYKRLAERMDGKGGKLGRVGSWDGWGVRRGGERKVWE